MTDPHDRRTTADRLTDRWFSGQLADDVNRRTRHRRTAADETPDHAPGAAHAGDEPGVPWQRVRVHWPDGTDHDDEVRGGGREEALDAARRNWITHTPYERAARVEYLGPQNPPTPEVPGDAARACGADGCDGTLTPAGDVHSLDAGDGSASIDLACDSCSVQSAHYWELTDDECVAQFGYTPDDQVGSDDPRGDDDGFATGRAGLVPVSMSSAVTGSPAALPGEPTGNPHLVVTPAADHTDRWTGWAVTHVPTGLRLGPAVDDVDDARQVAGCVAGLDWSSDDPSTYRRGYGPAITDAYRGVPELAEWLDPAAGRLDEPADTGPPGPDAQRTAAQPDTGVVLRSCYTDAYRLAEAWYGSVATEADVTDGFTAIETLAADAPAERGTTRGDPWRPVATRPWQTDHGRAERSRANHAAGRGDAVAAELRRLADEMDPATGRPTVPDFAVSADRTRELWAAYLRIRAGELDNADEATRGEATLDDAPPRDAVTAIDGAETSEQHASRPGAGVDTTAQSAELASADSETSRVDFYADRSYDDEAFQCHQRLTVDTSRDYFEAGPDYFNCTLPAGHGDEHEARGIDDELCASWPQYAPVPTDVRDDDAATATSATSDGADRWRPPPAEPVRSPDVVAGLDARMAARLDQPRGQATAAHDRPATHHQHDGAARQAEYGAELTRTDLAAQWHRESDDAPDDLHGGGDRRPFAQRRALDRDPAAGAAVPAQDRAEPDPAAEAVARAHRATAGARTRPGDALSRADTREDGRERGEQLARWQADDRAAAARADTGQRVDESEALGRDL